MELLTETNKADLFEMCTMHATRLLRRPGVKTWTIEREDGWYAMPMIKERPTELGGVGPCVSSDEAIYQLMRFLIGRQVDGG